MVEANAFLLLRLHHKPSSPGLVLFCPSQAVLIRLCEMLFLTVPGGTASLQRGLFMGSPGMYIRGLVKGGDIRKGRGVFGAHVKPTLSHRGLSFACVSISVRTNLGFNLQSDEVLKVFTTVMEKVGLGFRVKVGIKIRLRNAK